MLGCTYMNYLFNSIHHSINFYGFVQSKYVEFIHYMKTKAFEHKLIYYASYDLNTQEYIVTQNYDSVWYILYFYITNYLFKLNYAGLSYTDLDFLIKIQDMVIITTYVLNGREYRAIYDEQKKYDWDAKYKIVYAFTDKNDDITHSLNSFKNSVALFKLSPQHIYNIVTHYEEKYKRKHIKEINYMRDDTFEEIALKEIVS